MTYDGDLWTAKWWTEGDTPGGSGTSRHQTNRYGANVMLFLQRVSGRTRARARCTMIPGREQWLNVYCYATYKLCHWACARVYAVCIVDRTANDNTHCIATRTSAYPKENVWQKLRNTLLILIGKGMNRRSRS